MSEWKKVKLDDCLELITYGFTNPMPDTLSGPWKVTAKDINNGRIVFETARHTSQEAFDNDLTDKSRPKKGDILLTKDGTLGRLAIVGDERVCINQSVALLRVNKDILSVPYLYYLLSTPLYQAKMIADAGGAAIKHIYITRVNQLLIPCPSYDEQCRIANILSRYDSLIENYQKQIKLLEEAAQRLYKEWFVNLHFPGHENTKIVDGVPEGWEKKRLIDLVDVQYGYAFDGKLFNSNGEGMPILRIRNIPDGTTSDYTTEEASPNYIVHDGDIVVGMDGIFHINSWNGGDAYLVQRACSFRPKEESTRGFIFQAIQEPIKYFEQTLVGATVAHLGKKHIDSIELIVPANKDLYIPFQKGFKQRQSLLSQIRLLTDEWRDSSINE